MLFLFFAFPILHSLQCNKTVEKVLERNVDRILEVMSREKFESTLAKDFARIYFEHRENFEKNDCSLFNATYEKYVMADEQLNMYLVSKGKNTTLREDMAQLGIEMGNEWNMNEKRRIIDEELVNLEILKEMESKIGKKQANETIAESVAAKVSELKLGPYFLVLALFTIAIIFYLALRREKHDEKIPEIVEDELRRMRQEAYKKKGDLICSDSETGAGGEDSEIQSVTFGKIEKEEEDK